MKTIVSLLFVASIGLNAAFLLGCKSIHDFCYGDPCRFATSEMTQQIQVVDEGRVKLLTIAEDIGLQTEGRESDVLQRDIRHALSERIKSPRPFDDQNFENMCKDLPPSKADWVNSMREYQGFIRKLNGRGVIVIRED